MWVGCKLVQTGLQVNAPSQSGAHSGVTQYILSVTARAFCCKHLRWEWCQVELVLPGHQPKDVTTHRWSQLPFYPLHLHLVSSEQELLPCDSDAFIEWTAIQMAISGIETVTLRCKGVWRSVRLNKLALAALQNVTKSLGTLRHHTWPGNWIPRKCLNQHRT